MIFRKTLFLSIMAIVLISACKTADIGNPTQELIDEANALVQAAYPNAVLLEIHGIIPGGSGMNAGDVTMYEFIYGLEYQTVVLLWQDEEFSDPELVNDVWLGSFPIPLPLELSLENAIEKMREAGYASPFTAMTIRMPVSATIYTEAFYIFTISGQPFVFVGTKTGTVFTSY
jgi:hypothetical protein